MKSVQLFVTRTYERAVRKLMPDNTRVEMEAAVVTDPENAPIIPGTGGIRKLRWAGSGRGKRGGIRAIYLYDAGAKAVYLLTVYAKAERGNLTSADKKRLSRLVASIKTEGKVG